MRGSVTFVGPIQETGPKRAKRWTILVLQTGAPIQLDYDTEEDAASARRALLQAPNAYSVPTVKLLHGVHKALQLAAKATTSDPEAADDVEPEEC